VPALGHGFLTGLYDPLIRFTVRERTFKERLLDQAALTAGQRVLDLGCGTGTLAIWAKEREPRIEIAGVDGDAEVLRRAAAKAAKAGVEIDLRHGMAHALPFEEASFDRVLTSLFFHHLPRDVKERCAAEVARVLKPGGELHLADWGPGDPLMRLAFLSTQLLDGFERTSDNVAGRLPEILSGAGLRDVRERHRLRTVSGAMVLLSARR
jgi:ubiquinone/menaquinone biosynthesis C-methylase UbiE